MSYAIEETAEVGIATLHRCSDGVVEVRIRPGARIEEPSMRELLTAQAELTLCASSLLVDARPVLSMSKRAHEMAANSPVTDRVVATAIIVQSPVSTLLGNFFIRFARPPYPTRLFRDEGTARSWLHAQPARGRDG